MNQTYLDLCYLTGVALHGAGAEGAQGMDPEALTALAKAHKMSALALEGLTKIGGMSEEYKTLRDNAGKAVYQVLQLDMERKALISFSEERKIPYMPLKGSLLKELYPKNGLREMCDNDILYDVCRQKEVADFFTARGYQAQLDLATDDSFLRGPLHFEMHRKLFSVSHDEIIRSYYENVWDRLEPVRDGSAEFRFTDEDFYVYCLAHAFKHYDNGGTGLRILPDLYLFEQKHPNLDFGYIRREADKLGFGAWAEEIRALAKALLDVPSRTPNLTPAQEEMLTYLASSGAYGFRERRMQNTIAKTSKAAYLWRRIFPPMSFYRDFEPFYYRHKLLIPFCWLKRLFRGLGTKRKSTISELQEWKRQK